MQKTSWSKVVLFLGKELRGAEVGKVPPVLNLIQNNLGLSLTTAAWGVSIFTTIDVILGCISGAFADILGYYRLILFGQIHSATVFTVCQNGAVGNKKHKGIIDIWRAF